MSELRTEIDLLSKRLQRVHVQLRERGTSLIPEIMEIESGIERIARDVLGEGDIGRLWAPLTERAAKDSEALDRIRQQVEASTNLLRILSLVERQRSGESADPGPGKPGGPRRADAERLLFISHSSDDVRIARALVDLFSRALGPKIPTIRCTSLAGHRLSSGTRFEDVLRHEAIAADAFVALITPSSLASPYVYFEMGARWGARRPLIPVLARGLRSDNLPDPLKSLVALDCRMANQAQQLVEDVTKTLGQNRTTPPSAYQEQIQRLNSSAQAKGKRKRR